MLGRPSDILDAAGSLTIEDADRSDAPTTDTSSSTGVSSSRRRWTRRSDESARRRPWRRSTPPLRGLTASRSSDFLLEWAERRRPTTEPELRELQQVDDWTAHRFVLAFVPTAQGYETPASVGWLNGQPGYGGHETVVAALRHWHERWGAELFYNIGVHPLLRVERPPPTVFDAFELVAEQRTFDTDSSLRARARATMGSPTWSLIARP